MDSEAGVQGHIEGSADTTPSTSGTSSQAKTGERTKKASLKRKSNVPTGAKAKKQKKATVNRPARPSYTVQEGEDMPLVISQSSQYDNIAWRPKKKGSRKKKHIKGKAKAIQNKAKKTVRAKPKLPNNPLNVVEAVPHHPGRRRRMDHRWGPSLPEEVLVHIFQMVVIQDGAVPFLFRMARVCRLWNAAASAPSLWRRVSLSYGGYKPGKTQLPEMKMDTFHWLVENRFSQLRDFSLCHWEKNVDYAVEVVSQSCPRLCSLTLSYCKGVTWKTFQSLGANSRSLEGINVQYSE
ncbi:F-box/LRR-repeat protein 6-like, partial [Diretmus argenteus]